MVWEWESNSTSNQLQLHDTCGLFHLKTAYNVKNRILAQFREPNRSNRNKQDVRVVFLSERSKSKRVAWGRDITKMTEVRTIKHLFT